MRGVLDGQRELFCGTDELLELWRVWTSLLEACEAGGGPPPELLRAGHPWARGQAMLDAGFCVRNS